MDTRPFRILEEDDTSCLLDWNHPLARYDIEVKATLLRRHNPVAQRGGSLEDIAELLCNDGPGMKVPVKNTFRQMYGGYPLPKRPGGSEEHFYAKPRLAHHLDAAARLHVQNLYGRLLKPGTQILDLMASMDSHLPEQFLHTRITGLGMNKEEMQANPFIQKAIVHNLNITHELPFLSAGFDAVICTVSIEYLISPLAVLEKIHRILKPDGIVVFVVSDRWFPGLEISAWADLHNFEKMGFTAGLLAEQKGFTAIATESFRNYPRPADDKLFGKRFVSDPVFATWSRKAAT